MPIIRAVVADDHAEFREALKKTLHRTGVCVVGEADTGDGAVQAVRQSQPDVVILDLVMPGMNGIQAARAIAESHPHIPAILLTGHSDRHFIKEATRYGIAGYVLKSRAADELAEAIENVCQGVIHRPALD